MPRKVSSPAALFAANRREDQQRADLYAAQDLRDTAERFGYLYARWQDEKQYEDFADYVRAFAKILPPGYTLEAFTKRPFRVVLLCPNGERRYIRAGARGVEWGKIIPRTPKTPAPRVYRYRTGERYIKQRIEDCRPGDALDQGLFAGIDPPTVGQGPNTVNVRLDDGSAHYTETAGALVRVWLRGSR